MKRKKFHKPLLTESAFTADPLQNQPPVIRAGKLALHCEGHCGDNNWQRRPNAAAAPYVPHALTQARSLTCITYPWPHAARSSPYCPCPVCVTAFHLHIECSLNFLDDFISEYLKPSNKIILRIESWLKPSGYQSHALLLMPKVPIEAQYTPLTFCMPYWSKKHACCYSIIKFALRNFRSTFCSHQTQSRNAHAVLLCLHPKQTTIHVLLK